MIGALNTPLYVFILLILEINKLITVCYQEAKQNSEKQVLFGPLNSRWQSFLNFQGKDSRGRAFLQKVAGSLTLPGNVLLGNL